MSGTGGFPCSILNANEGNLRKIKTEMLVKYREDYLHLHFKDALYDHILERESAGFHHIYHM